VAPFTRSPDQSPSARPEEQRAARIAARLRQNAVPSVSREQRLPSFALEHAVSGDLGHLHAAHDLRALPRPIGRHRLVRPVVFRLRRAMLRGLHPLPEAQSVWNGAAARVISFLLRQIVSQARAIERLEQELAELQDQLRR
jgi:hypothetical protein